MAFIVIVKTAGAVEDYYGAFHTEEKAEECVRTLQAEDYTNSRTFDIEETLRPIDGIKKLKRERAAAHKVLREQVKAMGLGQVPDEVLSQLVGQVDFKDHVAEGRLAAGLRKISYPG